MKSFLHSCIFILLLLINSSSFADQLPDLGTSSYGSLPQAEEQRLGTLFMQQVRQSIPIIKDPVLNHYINALGKTLVSNSTEHQRRFDFFIIDSADINAFAGPAAHVAVNAGTILLAKNEDELAGVMAHEISHVSQHHLARAMEKARGSTLTALATVAAAIIIGSATGHGDAAMGGLMAAQTLTMESQLGYSRDNEREADRIGIQVLHKSHYNPQAMPHFLKRMSKQQIDLLDGRFSYLRTHPVNEERIADAKSRADHYPAHDYTKRLTFHLMQMRLLALSGQYTPTKLQHFSDDENGTNAEKSLAKRYGHALLLQRGAKFSAAENEMRALFKAHPENHLFALSLADIYISEHNLAAALQLLEKAQSLEPDYPPLLLSYAEVLLQQNNAEKALQLLDRYVKDHNNNDVDILQQLAIAQAKNGHVSHAYLTRARIYQLTDNPTLARLQFQQAAKYANPSEKAYIKNEMLKTMGSTIGAS
jgi:predicted Zn-dependent protease